MALVEYFNSRKQKIEWDPCSRALQATACPVPGYKVPWHFKPASSESSPLSFPWSWCPVPEVFKASLGGALIYWGASQLMVGSELHHPHSPFFPKPFCDSTKSWPTEMFIPELSYGNNLCRLKCCPFCACPVHCFSTWEVSCAQSSLVLDMI